MTGLDREPTAEKLRETLRAEGKLADLDFAEDIAEFYEQEPEQELREQYAESYRRIVGVHPAQRRELRQSLERIQETGRVPVKDVIDGLCRRFRQEEGVRRAIEKETPIPPVSDLLRQLLGR